MKTHFVKKLLSLALALVMVLGLLPMNALTASAAATEGYDGTPVTPTKISSSNYAAFGLTDSNWSSYDGYYGIRNAKELYGFSDLVNNAGGTAVNGLLLNDILVNQTVGESGAKYSWNPIGNPENPYIGTFDGNGHTISGLYIKTQEPYIGLFGLAGKPTDRIVNGYANINNVVLQNSYIAGGVYVGGIAGAAWGNSVTVSSCKVADDVVISAIDTDNPHSCVGGIVGGYTEQNMFFTRVNQVADCVCFGTVQTVAGEYHIGAIVGYYREAENAKEYIEVSNCYYLQGCATDCNGDSEQGKGCIINQTNKGCTILTGTNSSHECNNISVTHQEIKATCQYEGRSEYSYCLICNQITEGQDISYDITDHSYSAATCKKPATCVYCGKTVGSIDADNHEGNITSYKEVDDNYHYGIYACCGGYTENREHTFKAATCQEIEICSDCGKGRGSIDQSNHIGEEKVYSLNASDRTKHDYKWKCCGLTISTISHSFDNNGYCSMCDYYCEHFHTGSGKCLDCGKTGVGYINRYWDNDRKEVVSEVALAIETTTITQDTQTMENGWYVLDNDVEIADRITIKGTVHLILVEGCTLKANRGIQVGPSATLYIYGQTAGSGKISALPGASGQAASIGGNYKENCGTIVINGGIIEAGATHAAAIGGGYLGGGGNITINGGFIVATSTGSGAAIGSGIGGTSGSNASGTVSINGGTVTAINSATYNAGAGIGGGNRCNGYTVIINGGNVKAAGGKNSAEAIGKGNGSASSGTLKDGNGNDLLLQTITLNGAATDTAVTALKGIHYGLNNVYTLDTNKLYFYLPANTAATSITAGGAEYICKDSDLTYYTSHNWSKADGVCVRCGETCEHENQTGNSCGICGIALHTHAWSYTADGDTIIATCEGAVGSCPDAEQSITICAEGKTYDGEPFTATLDGAIDGVAAPEISYSGNTNAGTYTASITVEGKTASVEFTIEKATVTVTADAKSKTYGTDNPELTYTASGLFGSDALTGALATTATKTSNAGEYDITVGTLAGSNYIINFVGAKLTITKAAAPAIVWPTAAELTYGQKLSDSTLTSEDENGTFAWQDGSIVPTVTNNGYVVVYTPKDTDNYDYSSVAMEQTISVTVSKVSATVTAAPTPNDLTYTGEAQNLINGGEAEGGEMQYSTDNQNWSITIPRGTDAGKYTVYYKVVGDANHSDTAVDSVEITIAKAKPFCAAPVGLTVLYGQTLADVLLPENAPGETAGKWVWEDATTAAMKTGKHNFPAIFVPTDSENYEDVQMELEVEVTCDHEFNVNEATCVSPKQCSICGEIIAEIDPNNHSHETIVIAPTCTGIGYTVYSCVCGDTYSADVVSALGHSYDSGVVTLEPTCTEEGLRLYTCTVCGETKEEAEPMVAHTPGEKQEIVIVAPECDKEGLKQTLVHCTVCGLGLSNEVEKLPALAHSNDYNGDGKLDNDDVIELLWYTLYPAHNTEKVCTDVDHNGLSDNGDVLALLWYVLFPEENPL